jgi:flagellar basal-body rod modification protein FlgD
MALNSLETYQNLGLSPVADKQDKPKKQELGQDQFLKLMTTQMTHQDPTKPMENGDFLAQMAQFSTVEGIGSLNDSFAEFSASITSGQALQASALVGQSVLVPSDKGIVSLDKNLSGEVVLKNSTDNLQISFQNTSGETVKTIQLGQQKEGNVSFDWDGLLDDGTHAEPGEYKIVAEANIDGDNTVLEAYVNAGVESVAMGGANKGVMLTLAGLGEVSFNDVKKIF